MIFTQTTRELMLNPLTSTLPTLQVQKMWTTRQQGKHCVVALLSSSLAWHCHFYWDFLWDGCLFFIYFFHFLHFCNFFLFFFFFGTVLVCDTFCLSFCYLFVYFSCFFSTFFWPLTLFKRFSPFVFCFFFFFLNM